MRLISIDSLQPHHSIAFPVVTSDGRRILSENTPLNEYLIGRLKQMGIKYIYIRDERFSDIIVKEPISPQTRSNALKACKSAIGAVASGKDINEGELKEVSKQIVEDIRTLDVPVTILNGLYPEGDVLAYHAVNTAILSTCMGIQLSYNFSQLCDVCLAGLIHDIGCNSVEDDDKVEHTQRGFEVLRKTATLNAVSVAVTLQHHENFDGSGFPRALKGMNISEFARVVSVADYFDTLISGQKGLAMPHDKAFSEILDNEKKKFDPEVIKVFKNTVQVYFNGAMVVLNDGRQGIVVRQSKAKPLRPVIRLFSDSVPNYFEEIDLVDKFDLRVHKMIIK